jgi:replicative DNA helicase
MAADLMLLLHRDEVYRPDTSLPGTVEIDVARNRHGVPGRLRLGFRPEYARFENLC